MARAKRTNSMSKLSKSLAVHEHFDPSKSVADQLSEEEREDIEAEVLAEIEDEQREKNRKLYKSETRRRIRLEAELDQPHEQVLIDLPGHANNITIDIGRTYWHGHSYSVPQQIAQSLYDIMDKAWRHEETVGNANSNAYQKPKHDVLSGTGNHVINTRQGMIAPSISEMSKGRTSLAAQPL